CRRSGLNQLHSRDGRAHYRHCGQRPIRFGYIGRGRHDGRDRGNGRPARDGTRSRGVHACAEVSGLFDHRAVSHGAMHVLWHFRRVSLPGVQHRHELSGLLSEGLRDDSVARRLADNCQEPGFRNHYRPGRLYAGPASPRRAGSRWERHDRRSDEVHLPCDRRGPDRHIAFLPDGMERRRMTNAKPNVADAVISISGLSVSLGAKSVLDCVDLDVYRGEILVLLGGSGSGKTTLLKQALGLARPTSGSIRINGVEITSCSASEMVAVRRRIGVAFQESALFNSLTVEENVALPLQELTRLADSIIELMVWMKLQAVGLVSAAKLYPRELSGGMRKRAAIARAIAMGPR